MQLDPFRRLFDTVPAARWQALLDAGDQVKYDDGLGMWTVVGDANVDQVFHDTVTFADVTTMVEVRPITTDTGHVDRGVAALHHPSRAARPGPHPRRRCLPVAR